MCSMFNRNNSQVKKKYPKNSESFLEDMHQKHATCFLSFMKMHVTNPHFCKWLKMECLFRVNQPNFFIILCYQAFGRPKLTSCRFSFFNITICSPNLCNWANKLLDKNMFYCQGRKLRILNQEGQFASSPKVAAEGRDVEHQQFQF